MIIYKYDDPKSIKKVKATAVKRNKKCGRTIIKASFILTQDENLVNLLKLKNIHPVVVSI